MPEVVMPVAEGGKGDIGVTGSAPESHAGSVYVSSVVNDGV